jgi:FlaG/FlaF family flagellin (archaellin)
MRSLRKLGLIAAAALAVLALGGAGSASALVEPNTGQPGAGSKGQTVESNNHCGEVNKETGVSAVDTPGKSGESNGSTHNPTGTSTEHYAGNPGTKSLKNSNSSAAVSQYDISCVNATRVAAK